MDKFNVCMAIQRVNVSMQLRTRIYGHIIYRRLGLDLDKVNVDMALSSRNTT
uniref:Uncharacterized protein n=1 Tax=Picea glauca TaxID=3330 RepID=A0A117NI93_PICGL|nr:hypothetical protein ABT39_MTgene2806 [Picea glauca]QHR87661.1 hypothetical protein Q903MT_gene1673 [Picea sitchensis]